MSYVLNKIFIDLGCHPYLNIHLKKGGIMMHLDNTRLREFPPLESFLAAWEVYNNNESFGGTYREMDLTREATKSGFAEKNSRMAMVDIYKPSKVINYGTNIEKVLKKKSNKKSVKFADLINEEISENRFFSENKIFYKKLDPKKIFHIQDIKKVCIDYRLRFLDSSFYKGKVPNIALNKIDLLQKEHQTRLNNFKIMGPSSIFQLEKKDDPLLFVPLGNSYFYLVHKWGNDLHPFRKIMMWSFKSIWNLLLSLLGLSWIATELTPMGLFTKNPDSASYWMLYFFMFKAIASIVLFYGFAMGKNFNPAIWNSKYNKS